MSKRITEHRWFDNGVDINGMYPTTTIGDYDEYSFMAFKQPESRWDRAEGVTLTLYVHDETGIVTTKPFEFEESRGLVPVIDWSAVER